MYRILVLFVLFILNSIAYATSTPNSGQAYIEECAAAGVPIPPDWGTEGWEARGPVPDTFIFQSVETLTYVYRSTNPRGLCIALPRVSGGTNVVTLGLICQGNETSKACFFEVTPDSLGQASLPLDQVIPFVDFESGFALEAHNNGICSDCHAGENVFIVHPGTPLQAGLEDLLYPDGWVDPIVHPDWPQNPGPTDQLDGVDSEGSCLQCHNAPGFRLPEVSTGLPGFCGTVLSQAVDRTMPPSAPGSSAFAAHADALADACDQLPRPRIFLPTTDDPQNAGDRTDPGKIWVHVAPPLRRTYELSAYTVTINGVVANIVDGLEVDRQFWMVVQPAADSVSTEGVYDLTVSVTVSNQPTDSATAVDAVRFGEPGMPVDMMVVGDVSGSMGEFGKLEAAQNAARLFVDHADNGDRIGVVSFATEAGLDMPIAPVNSASLNEAKDRIDGWIAGGTTALGQGILSAYGQLQTGDTDRQWRMAVLSDDLENVPPLWADPDNTVVRDTILGSPSQVFIDMVSLGPDAAVDLARDVAQTTGGRYYRVSLNPEQNASLFNTLKDRPAYAGYPARPEFFLPAAEIDFNDTSLPNRLAAVYKTMAETARAEQRIGDWDGRLDLPGESDTFDLTLESGLPEVLIAVNWDRPNDNVFLSINGQSCSSFYFAEFTSDATHVQCRIFQPAPGPISITVGLPDIDVPRVTLNRPDGEMLKAGFTPVQISDPDALRYKLMVSAYSHTTMMPLIVSEGGGQGEGIRFVVFVGDGLSVPDATLWVEVVDPSGQVHTVDLFNDGQHGDGEAGDGFYGNVFDDTSDGGHYGVRVIGTGVDNGDVPFKRVGTDTVFVEDRFRLPVSLLATESLVLSDRVLVESAPGDNPFGEVYGGQYFELGADSRVNGDVTVNGTAFMRSRSVIDGDLDLGQTLTTQDGAQVTGEVRQNTAVAVPVIPSLTFTHGTGDIMLNNDQTATWEPGRYRDGVVRARGTLTLTGGDYFFRSLNIEPNTQVILDTSDGDIVIHSETALQIGNNAAILGARADTVTFYTNASGTVTVGTDLNLDATLVAPSGEVQVFSRTSVANVAARKIRIEPDVRVNLR